MTHDTDVQNILHKIEKDARNEFGQLTDIGAEFFSTAELLRLKGKWEATIQHYFMLNKILTITGATSPIWVILAFPIGLLGFDRLAYFIMGIFPISFFIYLIGSYFMKKHYKSKSHLNYIGAVISEELKKRSFKRRASR